MPSQLLLDEDARNALCGVPVEALQGKTVILTGATGVVGIHFLACLSYAQRHMGVRIEVIAVSRRAPPSHVKHIVGDANVRFLSVDIAEPKNIALLPTADVIIHSAGYGQPALFLDKPLSTIKLNTAGTLGLLDRLRATGAFLFLSSSEVYSGLGDPPFREDQIGSTSPSHSRACYIEAKRCAEAICHAARAGGVNAKAARLALAYGPGARSGDRRVLYSLIERGAVEGRVRILDRGLAWRTYCYVGDAVHMMLRVLLEGRQAVYNVGGISRTTIRGLADAVGGLMNVPVDVPEGDAAAALGAPDDVWLDLSQYEAEFGPVKFTDLNTGLRRCIRWHREVNA